jgi:hypothetical protein
MRTLCYRCGERITHSRDAMIVMTLNGDSTVPACVRLCDACATRWARWLHRRPAKATQPPAEAPVAPVADARPIRLAVPSDAFLKPPTGPAGWRPSPPA